MLVKEIQSRWQIAGDHILRHSTSIGVGCYPAGHEKSRSGAAFPFEEFLASIR